MVVTFLIDYVVVVTNVGAKIGFILGVGAGFEIEIFPTTLAVFLESGAVFRFFDSLIIV